jgi:hypothetical protein
METSPRDAYGILMSRLSEEETALEVRCADIDTRLSGLKDLDLLLKLVDIKLTLCLRMMERIGSTNADEVKEKISMKALSAFGLMESLMSENISEDQKEAVLEDPLFSPVKQKLQEFMIKGGGGFLESLELDERKWSILSRAISAAMRKYMGADDRYPPAEMEKYPPFIRRVLLSLFPVFFREKPEKPPYGIEEGEEVTYSSQKMKLPLSQAIFYMENELLPELRKKLAESPGERGLQEEIGKIESRMEEYRKLRFFPRSTPVLLEHGFYTEGMTSYSEDGEMLVPIPLSVSMRSGTNLDRKMELVRMDIVKRLAGKDVCPELDDEYRRLKSLESGIRGSSRTASMKINAVWGFRVLKREFPALSLLQEKDGFRELLSVASMGSAGPRARRIAALLREDQRSRAGLPSFIEISRTSPS